jgi:MFS family permease
MTLANTGIEVGGTVMAVVAAYLIMHAGWRTAYLVLAAPVLLLVVPAILLVVRSRPAITAPALAQGARTVHSTSGEPTSLSGLEVGTALRERSFWLIAISYAIYAVAGTALVVHLVPLPDRARDNGAARGGNLKHHARPQRYWQALARSARGSFWYQVDLRS